MLRVMMLGLRGFPGVQGGVEAHAEHLCKLLQDLDYDVEVVVRAPYVPKDRGEDWHGVRYVRILVAEIPRARGDRSFVSRRAGGGLEAPGRPAHPGDRPRPGGALARALGLHVVVTHHGADYEREKWGLIARAALSAGEALGMRFCDRRIAISRTIRKLVSDKYGLEFGPDPKWRRPAGIAGQHLGAGGIRPDARPVHPVGEPPGAGEAAQGSARGLCKS